MFLLANLSILVLAVRFGHVLSHECVCEGDLGLYTETNEHVDCDDIKRESCRIRSIRNRCCITCETCGVVHDGEEAESDPGAASDCFAADGRILTNHEFAQIQDLPEMENVLVQAVDDSGVPTFVPIQLWIHKDPVGTSYLKISTDTDDVLTISPLHLLFTVPCDGDPVWKAVFAKRVEVGQCVLIANEKGCTPSKVVKVEEAFAKGRYVFVTETGNVVVNNVVASTYSQIEYQGLQHVFFQLLYKLQSFVKGPGFQGIASWLTRDLMNPVVDLMYEGFKGL